MINTEYREALVEVLEIINHLEEDEKSKIPSEIVEFYEKNKSKTYIPNINFEEEDISSPVSVSCRHMDHFHSSGPDFQFLQLHNLSGFQWPHYFSYRSTPCPPHSIVGIEIPYRLSFRSLTSVHICCCPKIVPEVPFRFPIVFRKSQQRYSGFVFLLHKCLMHSPGSKHTIKLPA